MVKQSLVNQILEAGIITERQIITLKSRMNAGKLECDWLGDHELKITPEQTEKGLNWIKNQYKGKSGKVRKNNPLENREIAILEDFDHFLLVDFWNVGNYRPYYLPVYRVVDSRGRFFDYYYNGKINIISS